MLGQSVCMSDGTGLYTPKTNADLPLLSSWLQTVKPNVMVLLGKINGTWNVMFIEELLVKPKFSFVFLFPGYRKYKIDGQNEYLSPFSGSKLSEADFTQSIGNLLKANQDGESCFKFGVSHGETEYKVKSMPCYQTLDTRQPHHHKQVHVLCQYTECQTTDSKICKFPFRYKGRLYDTCITIDSDQPWCSLKTDINKNHIEGDENIGKCQPNCNVKNCPVGFADHNGNCFHLSPRAYHGRNEYFEHGKEICEEKGARLYQPRDYDSFEDFISLETEFLASRHFKYERRPTFISIGAETIKSGNKTEIYYVDGSRAYMIEHKFKEEFGEINSEQDRSCVMLDEEAKLSNQQCWSMIHYTSVGYICEAKNLSTIHGPDTGSSCQFPFKIQGQDEWLSSCATNTTYGVAWCPTKVDSSGMPMQDQWGYCLDERQIAYKGDGSGEVCINPFVYERIWYDKCFHDTEEGVAEGEDLWCPTEVSEERVFDEDTNEKGFCTKYMKPEDTGCNANYQMVNRKCIRVSAYAETYSEASNMCKNEGAHLLPLYNSLILPPILDHIDELNATKSYFQKLSSTKFWIGASAIDFTWRWEANGKNTSAYSNWAAADKGCSGGFCTSNYGMTIDQVEDYKWVAKDKLSKYPYICESKCLGGYIWYPTIKKCLKKIDEGESFPSALHSCSANNARLAEFRSCEEIEALGKDIRIISEDKPLGNFWVGMFSGDFANYIPQRVTESMKTEKKMITSFGLSGLSNCGSIINIDFSKETMGTLKFEDKTPKLEFLEIVTPDDGSITKGYLCEEEEEWSCPTGYLLFQEECYGLHEDAKTYTEALMKCNSDGGHLVRQPTKLHNLFISTILADNDIVLDVWTGYRKNIFEDKEDLFFTTTEFYEADFIASDLEGKKKAQMKIHQFILAIIMTNPSFFSNSIFSTMIFILTQ